MKIKYKKGNECALLFSILTMMFYTLQGSPLFFGQLKVMIFVAAMSAVVAIIKKVKMKVRYKMIWVAMSGFCVLISIANTQDTRLIISMLAMILGAVYDVHELITGAFVAKLVTFVLVMLSGGYSHINGCALHGGVVMLLYIAVVGSKLTKKNIAICLLLYLALLYYTKSGSLIICGGVAVALLAMRRLRGIKKIVLSRAMQLFFPIMLSINTISAALFYQTKPPLISNILYAVDNFVSHRIELAAYSLMRFGITCFGGNVEFDLMSSSVGSYFNLDSGYMWLLQGSGIVVTVLFMMSTVIMLKRFSEKKEYELVVVAIVISLWGLNEDMLLSLGMNFLYYYMGHAMKKTVNTRKVRIRYANS